MRSAPARRHTQRPLAGRAASRPWTICSSGSPSATPTPAAASAFVTLCRPAKWSRRARRPSDVSRTKLTPSGVSSISPARMSAAPRALPKALKVQTRAGLAAAIARTRGSSAFSTTAPPAGMIRTSALFSRWTSSREPRNSVWAEETVVTAAMVGRAISASAAISPGLLVPSSSAAARCSAVSLRRVSGSPHWLLKLDSGLSTGPSTPSTAAIISLVVVLPFEPVTAATGIEKRWRCHAASRPRALVVSSTSTTGTPGGRSSGTEWITRQAAPRPTASRRKP